LIVAMIYLERLRLMDKNHFESSDPADLFSSALLCASKFLYDNDDEEFVYNDEWAASCSKSLDYINAKEVEFLNGISWNIIARQEDFFQSLRSIEQHIALNESLKRNYFTYADITILLQSENLAAFIRKEIIEPLLQAVIVAATIYTAAVFGLYAVSLQLTNPVLSRLSTSCCSAPLDLKCRIDCPVLPSVHHLDAAADSSIPDQPHDHIETKLHTDFPSKFVRYTPKFAKVVRMKSPMIETFDNDFNLCFDMLPLLKNSSVNVTKKLLDGLMPFNFDMSF